MQKAVQTHVLIKAGVQKNVRNTARRWLRPLHYSEVFPVQLMFLVTRGHGFREELSFSKLWRAHPDAAKQPQEFCGQYGF